MNVLFYLLFLFDQLGTKVNQSIAIFFFSFEQICFNFLSIVHQKQVITLHFFQSLHQLQNLSVLNLPFQRPSRFGLVKAVFLAFCRPVYFLQFSLELDYTVFVSSQFVLIFMGNLPFFFLMSPRDFLSASPFFSYFFELVLVALDLLLFGCCDLIMLCEDILHFLAIGIFLILVDSLQSPHFFVERCVETGEFCLSALLEFQLAGELNDDLLILFGVLEVSSELLVLLNYGLNAEVSAMDAGEFAHFLYIGINFNDYQRQNTISGILMSLLRKAKRKQMKDWRSSRQSVYDQTIY